MIMGFSQERVPNPQPMDDNFHIKFDRRGSNISTQEFNYKRGM